MRRKLVPRSPPQPLLTDPATSERMRNIGQSGTLPELVVRSFLRSEGIRYRCNCRNLPGSPDLANRSKGWALFVHGCFWHGHHGCPRATLPKRNRDFWLRKIQANQERDKVKEEALRRFGLSVVTVWECEIRRLEVDGKRGAPASLLNLLRRRRE